MTKSEPSDTLSAFATLRFAGDRLVPDQITQILRVRPTQAYRKGEIYSAGPRSSKLRGRTGVWFLSTDKIVASRNLDDHISYLIGLLWPTPDKIERLIDLRQIIAKRGLKAHVTLFWHGRPRGKKPTVHPFLADFFEILPADIQLDFDVDEESPKRRVA